MKQRAGVVGVLGGSGLVALLLVLTTSGAPASLAFSQHHIRHSSGTTSHHASHKSAVTTTTSTSTSTTTSTEPSTANTASTTTTTTSTTVPIRSSSTTQPSQPATATTTPSPQTQHTTRFVDGKLSPPFTSTSVRQRTSAGVVSAVLTWSGTSALQAEISCGGHSQQRTGASGLYLAVHAPAGVCGITISEVQPTASGVVSYVLALSFEEAS